MNPAVFLTQLLPLVVFIIVDALVTDVRWSIACAVVFALGQLGYTWLRQRRLDWFVLVDVGLIVGLGGIAIVFDNDLFFKVKPAIIEGITILLVLGLVLAPDRFLLGYFGRMMPTLRPEAIGVMKSMLVWMASFTALHVSAVLYTAFRASKQTWAWVSGPGFYLLFVPILLFVLIKRRAAARRPASPGRAQEAGSGGQSISSHPGPALRPDRLAEIGSVVVGATLVVGLLGVALGRLFYPYELEWMEGGSVDHVRWILAGHPLYVRPTLAFIPYIYTPVYYYLSALLCRFVGVGFVPLRSISLAATLVTLVILYKLVRHETQSRWSAYLGVAFYAGTFSLTGYWFDLARVDSLEILFLALALYSVRRFSSSRAAALAGLCISLAFLTKQTALAGVLPLGAYLFVQSRRRLVAFLAATGVAGGGGFLLLDRLNGGWLRYYTVTLPANHETNAAAYLDFWTGDVSRLLPLAVAASVAGWLALRRSPRDTGLGAKLGFYGLTLLVFLGTSYSSRIHAGGETNVIMPAFLSAGFVFAIAAHILRTRHERGNRSAATPSAARGMCGALALHGFTLLQLSLLLYVPWKQIPSHADRLAGDAFLALLGRLEGDVYVMDHGYYPALVGKNTFAQGMAVVDVLRGDRGPAAKALAGELTSAACNPRFAAIVMGTSVPDGALADRPGAPPQAPEADSTSSDGIALPWIPEDFIAGLHACRTAALHLYRDSRDFAPVVGWRRRPAVVYLPRSTGSP